MGKSFIGINLDTNSLSLVIRNQANSHYLENRSLCYVSKLNLEYRTKMSKGSTKCMFCMQMFLSCMVPSLPRATSEHCWEKSPALLGCGRKNFNEKQVFLSLNVRFLLYQFPVCHKNLKLWSLKTTSYCLS